MSSMILTLDRNGQPMHWASWQEICIFEAKGLIKWTLGAVSYIAHGGKNRFTGEQSVITIPSIVSVDSSFKQKYRTPPLNNRNLFRRDLHTCAYCGHTYDDSKLTRDHIIPTAKGGENTWMNCITACKPCNNYKGDRLLQDIDMELLFAPYTPDRNENLILKNRSIREDQFEYLKNFIPAHSRAHSLVKIAA